MQYHWLLSLQQNCSKYSSQFTVLWLNFDERAHTNRLLCRYAKR
ncbi:hypothetical protein RNAN_1890 [Rheinheimera nanhaiensis E407-8]|uniref:Uncharacterized protein n=1 Tax=Rheinheimera nanhaiensis E407-8 TaxID=562729 RepID=I1DXX4_9GAMM|nr:hypothetical protein RNAN_1890 [Rheinheimera nanhaiensis E407-8]